MALEIDTSRAFLSTALRRSLVVAVRDAPQHESEPDWLEWKSTVDLTEKRWMAEIARNVLGLANRDPDRAERSAEGWGYLLLGVEPGNLCGVIPIDNAQLESGTAPYLGRDGPQMSPEYVDVGGTAVLVITVQAPRWGDRIYTFEKEYSYVVTDVGGGPSRIHYKNGEVFVRREGRTERAEAADFRMLERRLLGATARPQLDVELRCEGDECVVTPIDLGDEAIEAWVAHERQALRRPPESPPAPASPSPPLARAPIGLERLRELSSVRTEPESRSPDEYDEQVRKYLDAARSQLPNHLQLRAVTEELGVLRLAVHNNTEDNYEEVAVVLSFQGGVSAFFDEDDARFDLDVDFPRRPRRWGPRRVRSGLFPSELLLGSGMSMPRAPITRRGRIDNSASSRIMFEPFHLRPGYTVRRPDVHLVVPAFEAKTDEINGHWHATSTSVSGSAEGTLRVRLDRPLTPLELLSK
jgi:hypothetical protein